MVLNGPFLLETNLCAFWSTKVLNGKKADISTALFLANPITKEGLQDRPAGAGGTYQDWRAVHYGAHNIAPRTSPPEWCNVLWCT